MDKTIDNKTDNEMDNNYPSIIQLFLRLQPLINVPAAAPGRLFHFFVINRLKSVSILCLVTLEIVSTQKKKMVSVISTPSHNSIQKNAYVR
jgi:hypothetical protein